MAEFTILKAHAAEVAPRLLGSLLIREIDGDEVVVKIVETESYHQTDLASHSYRGMTKRTEVMFGPAGNLYVYFTYGMHYCANVVTGQEGEGSAVLIRAVEPVKGLEYLSKNRPNADGNQITNGPAKLCQALKIDKSFNGHNLRMQPLQLKINKALPAQGVVTTTRIGISQAKDKPWRFFIKDNPYVSKK